MARSLEEIQEQVESYQKQLDDYNLQIEALSNEEDLTSEDHQAKVDYVVRQISNIMDEIEKLLPEL